MSEPNKSGPRAPCSLRRGWHQCHGRRLGRQQSGGKVQRRRLVRHLWRSAGPSAREVGLKGMDLLPLRCTPRTTSSSSTVQMGLARDRVGSGGEEQEQEFGSGLITLPINEGFPLGGPDQSSVRAEAATIARALACAPHVRTQGNRNDRQSPSAVETASATLRLHSSGGEKGA